MGDGLEERLGMDKESVFAYVCVLHGENFMLT